MKDERRYEDLCPKKLGFLLFALVCWACCSEELPWALGME